MTPPHHVNQFVFERLAYGTRCTVAQGCQRMLQNISSHKHITSLAQARSGLAGWPKASAYRGHGKEDGPFLTTGLDSDTW